MADISYHVAAIALLFVVYLCYFLNKKTPFFHNKSFFIFIIAATLSSVFGLLSDSADRIVSINLIGYLLKWFYHISHAMCAPTALLYAISLRKEWKNFGRLERIGLLAPFVAAEALILTNPLTNLVFTYNDMQYHREKGIFFVYLTAAYYLVYIIVYTIVSRKDFSAAVMISICTLVVVMSGAVLVQMKFPTQRVENFGMSVCVLTILLTIQNPASVVDMSTGLYNRNTLIAMTKYDFEKRKKFYMLTIVIDDYERYSKSLGRGFTSSIIKEISKELFAIGAEKIYYLGGGVICVEFPSFSDINVKVSKICERFDLPWHFNNNTTIIPVRICVVVCPDDADNSSKLLDIATWFESNKTSGKVLYFSEVDNSCLTRASDVKSAVKFAVINESFEINYYPVYSFGSDKISYAEAQMYIPDSSLGAISFEEFFPVAEKSGDIAVIGERTFEEVCRFISSGGLESNGFDHIEIPVSVVQCMQDNMAEKYIAMMEKYNVAPQNICFRISESITAELSLLIDNYMNNLSQKGLSFCFDNYGIGKSDISFIYNLPFSYVKIAESVISAALSNGKAATMLESTLALMNELGIKTIAGGVDSENSFRMLCDMKCDFAEGAFFSPALEASELTAFSNNFKSPLKKEADSIAQN